MKLAHRVRNAIPFKREAYHALRSVWSPPRAVHQHLTFQGPFRVRVGSAGFTMDHFGSEVENSLFWTGYGNGFEGTSLRLWASLVPRAKCIVDVGANTGVYALAAAALNPSAEIHAFEPVARIFDRLVHNVELNGFGIRCHKAGLSDKNGILPLYDTGDDHLYSASFDPDMLPGARSGGVPAVRLDSFHIAPDLIKIDVERHEPSVLRGMRLDHRPTILLEVLDDRIGAEIEDIVRPLGYDYYRVDELSGVEPVLHIVGGGNVLLSPLHTDFPRGLSHKGLRSAVIDCP